MLNEELVKTAHLLGIAYALAANFKYEFNDGQTLIFNELTSGIDDLFYNK